MQIAIVAVGSPETKKSSKGTAYSVMEVTYKSDGQTRSKKLMSFDRPAYTVLKNAQSGEVYDIDLEKDGEYWKWKAVNKVDGTSSNTSAPRAQQQGTTTTRTGTWETPEERAIKQVYIARSVALAQAIALKPKANVDEIISTANDFEKWLLAPMHGTPPSLEQTVEDEDETNDIV